MRLWNSGRYERFFIPSLIYLDLQTKVEGDCRVTYGQDKANLEPFKTDLSLFHLTLWSTRDWHFRYKKILCVIHFVGPTPVRLSQLVICLYPFALVRRIACMSQQLYWRFLKALGSLLLHSTTISRNAVFIGHVTACLISQLLADLHNKHLAPCLSATEECK